MSGDLTRLDSRVVLVTGGAGGMGRAIAQLAADRGARVAIMDLPPGTDDAVASCGAVMGVATDVTDHDAVEAGVRSVRAEMGSIDVLINGAGWDSPALFADTDHALWQRLVAINYLGVLAVTHAALPALREAGGSVVSISSDTARVGGWGEAVYAGAKGAVVAFSKSLAREEARYGVRVNSIHPGLIETDMGEKTFVMRAQQQGTNDTEKARQATLGLHPIGRLGVAADIAKGIVFLASDDASFMTGAGLVVDGGWTAH